jgi:hypothetical protein
MLLCAGLLLKCRLTKMSGKAKGSLLHRRQSSPESPVLVPEVLKAATIKQSTV